MKKIIALLLTLCLVFALTACGGTNNDTQGDAQTDTTQNQTQGDTATDTQEPKLTTVTEGKLTVATSPDFAPYEFYTLDENGTPTLAGFELALAQYIADYAGLELEIIAMDFDGTMTELGNKTVDLGMAGYSPKPERETIMDFSEIFYSGGQSFVCLKDNAANFASLADTNKAEYQIGAQIGSIQADLAKENSPDADLVELTKVTDIIAELLTGKIDGAYIETVVAENYAKNYPELCVALEVPYDQEGSVVGVSKGNAELLAVVNEAIAAAKADGSIDKFIAEANLQSEGDTAILVDGEIVAD